MADRNWSTREGDTGYKDFRLTDIDAAGVEGAVNLTGVTAVVFRGQSLVDGSLFGYTTVAIQDAVNGVVRYTQGAAHFPAALSPYRGYFDVTAPGGIQQKFPQERDLEITSTPKYQA